MYILPDCLLSPCCCIYRVPYLNFKILIMMKNSFRGIALIQGFILTFCDSPIAMMKDVLLSVLEAISLLFQK